MSAENETASDFSAKMTKVVMDGFLCLSLAVGNRSGLWHLLSTFDQPKTCSEIAEAAGLKEKFVKEWLGAVVSGGIVHLDANEKFFLPVCRRNALIEGATGSDNYAEFACGLPVLMRDFDQMPSAMKIDGKGTTGFSWDDNCPGSIWYAHLSVDFITSHMIKGIVPLNKGLYELLEKGVNVLEIGCDVGTATNAIAEHFPKSTVIGIDINDEALRNAKTQAAAKNLKNVCYDNQNIYKMPADWSGRFDHVYAIDTIHGLRPNDSLKEIARILSPNGTFNLIEIKGNAKMADNKQLKNAPYLYVSGLVMAMQDSGHEHDHSHDNEHSHEHGHDSEESHCGEGPGWWWGNEAICKAVKDVGFKEVEEFNIPGSYTHVVYVCRK